MHNGLYRHSVWIDVFGVLLFGAVLLGGAGYLLYHAENAVTGLAVETRWQEEQALGAQRPRRGPVRRGASRRALAYSPPVAGPLVGEELGPPRALEAPFSEEWRDRATPRLSDPSPPSGGGLQGDVGGGAAARPGPAVASSQPSGVRGWESAGTGGSSGRASSRWRAEARRFAGRMRALSNELGQMARESSGREGGEASPRQGSSPEASAASASAASVSSSDRDVPDPPSVPIDDHLHWLLVAGVLWGVWRLWGG